MGSISTGRFAAHLDDGANIRSIDFQGQTYVPKVACTYFEIDGQCAYWARIPGADGHAYAVPAFDQAREDRVRSMEKLERVDDGWKLFILPRMGELEIRANNVAEGFENSRVSMSLSFPDSAKIHLAEKKTVGRLLDADMPLEESFETGMDYNLIIIELPGFALRFRTEDEQMGATRACVRRHGSTFTVTFTWRTGSAALLGAFENYDAAHADFLTWVRQVKKLRRLKDRDDVPAWYHDIRMALPINLLLSNWHEFLNYEDVKNLAKDAAKYIDPKKVLLYLTGWAGAFDGCEPAYVPAPELGGEAAFRHMIDAVHALGYHVMLHTTIWGIDPYDEKIEEYEAMSRKKDGKLSGWQICREREDRMIPFKFRSPRIALKDYAKGDVFTVPFGYVPGDCYAYMTVGGARGKGRIKLNHGRYPIWSPTGWFEHDDICDYIYPIYLSEGQADIEVTVPEGMDISDAFIQIRMTTTYTSPWTVWSRPMLMGRKDSDAYNALISKRLRAVTLEYGIDAMYLDAACFYGEKDGYKQTIMSIVDALPEKTVYACEFLSTWEEMDFWMSCFLQYPPDMLVSKFPAVCVREFSCPPMLEGVYKFNAWLDKTSPICDFAKEYIRYWAPGPGFKPVCHVANIMTQPRKIPVSDKETWRIFHNMIRMNELPNLRINYRDYGLDEQTILALREINALE